MKKIMFTAAYLLVHATLYGQDIKSVIEEKIWKLNESYMDSTLSQDTMYVYFTNDYLFRSGSTPIEVSPSFLPPPPTSTYSINNQKVIINDSNETFSFDVIYFDNDDLILQKQDTIRTYDGEGGVNEYMFTNELRFIME